MIYDISYKTLIGPRPLRIRFDKIDGFIRIFDGNTYLVLLCPERYDALYDRTRYFVSLKSGIIVVSSHYYAKIIWVDSYGSSSI